MDKNKIESYATSTIIIGIPVYNEEKTLYVMLASAVESAQHLNNNYEICVCFNGTTDNSKNIALDIKNSVYPNLRIIESKKGKTNAIKSIVGEFNSEYFIFCDADTIIEKQCFPNLIKNFSNLELMAVTGCPKPQDKQSLIYNILNARMLNPKSEIAKIPLNNNIEKPFIHGRIFAIKGSVFYDNEKIKQFQESIGDDTYLSHYIIDKYGRSAISKEYNARVKYNPVKSISS